MKPLKGEIEVRQSLYGVAWEWSIYVAGNIKVQSLDSYATKKGATRSAKNYAARCNIELEPSK